MKPTRASLTAALLLATLLGATLLGACSSSPVQVDLDPAYDFAGLDTYAWTEGEPAESELNERRIVAAVDEALAARGFTRVEQAPELLVRTKVGTRQEVRSTGSTMTVSHRRGWGGVGMSAGNQVYEVTVGTLVIELLDGPSGNVVWRSVGEKTVDTDPKRTAERIREVVETSFEDFPPAG